MWLLSTDRAELKYFTGPDAVLGEYAILSHTWEEKETSFQELQGLIRWCTLTFRNPRNHVQEKIRRSCILAEQHGHKWIWIDTCCIDKASSAELSEAINSMFRYYSMAAICYAFLRDVPGDCVLDEKDSAFRKSRWHTRGWTLQELVAPMMVIFVSSSWTILETKAQLANLLEEITLVPVCILRFEKDVADVSIAGRMRWASRRETTRAEDMAYSLMGVFGINMPTLYGEGKNAFYRLQEEIMRRYSDTSLFMWGHSLTLDEARNKLPKTLHYNHPLAPSGCQSHSFANLHLFASMPWHFHQSTLPPDSYQRRWTSTVSGDATARYGYVH